MKTLSFIACLLALALLLPTQPAQAQVAPGEVTGTVQNAAGATLPNQPITLENVATGQRFTTTSDMDGVYRVQAAPPGQYRVMVNTPAGTTAPTREFAVESGMVNTVNLTVSGLPAAAGTPVAPSGVIVTAQPVALTTATAQVFNTFNTMYNVKMPQSNYMTPQGRYFGGYNLTTLSQGVTAGGLGYSTAAGPDVAGIDPEFNAWRIGGVDNSNKIQFGSPMLYISPEATNEVTLFKGQYEPVFGHSIGGKSTLIPSAGSNAVHGSLYDFLQNRILNAKDPVLSAIPQSPRFDQNRLGGTIGAPVVRDKVYFSANFEYIPFGFDRLPVPFTVAPTPDGFAALSGNPGVDQVKLGTINSLVSGSVGAPTSTISVAGTTAPVGPINALSPGFQNSYMGMGNVDFHVSDKDTWHARYVVNRTTANAIALGLLPSAPNSDRMAFLASVSGDHVFSNSAINELRLGYNRWDQSRNPASSFSFLGFPSLDLSGGQTAFTGTQGFNQLAGIVNTYNLSDVLSWTRGSSTIQLGFDGLRTIGIQTASDLFTNPFSFTNLSRFLTATPASVIGLGSFGSPRYIGNQYLLSGWIQDTWKMRSSFQINLGVRYDYTTVPNQLNGSSLNAFLGVPGTTFTTPNVDTANFTPYFGFAWSPSRTVMNRDFVVRGSFSMNYAGLYGSALFKNGFPSMQISQIVQLNNTNPGVASGIFSSTTPVDPATISAITGRQVIPYTMNWNLSPQIGVGRSGVLELQYLGMRTVHLPVMKLLNTPSAVTALAAVPVFGGITPGTDGTLQGLTPFPATQTFPGLSTTAPLATFVPDGISWYNAGAARYTQRFSHGFQANFAYTYQHQINDSEGSVLDLASATRSKHSALYDRRQRLTLSGVMDLAPMFTGAGTVTRDILANFSLSGTYTFQSAQVVPIATMQADGLVSGVASNPSGPGFVPVGSGAALNPFQAAFKLQKTNNFNLSAVKGFRFSRMTLEARGDAYNLVNHAQITGAPINTVVHGNFDAIGLGSFNDPFNSAFNNSFLLSTNPRMLTVALRLIF